MKRFSGIKLTFHILGWALFFIAPVLLSPGPVAFSISFENIMTLTERTVIWMGLFYFNLFYLTPVTLKKKGAMPFFIVLIGLVIIVSFFNAGFHEFFSESRKHLMKPPPFDNGGGPPFEREGRHPPIMIAGPAFSSLLITIIVAGISSLLVLWEDWIDAQAERQEQMLQKIAAELTALKLQISPHFLFNTLNNIRWLVRSKSEHAEDAVVKLSHLLRYILYQAEADQVDLEKEINHLTDFIALQKMRLANLDTLRFSIDGDPSGKRIVPLLLLPLVENFFKHCDFTGGFQNNISLTIQEHQLVFRSDNRIVLSDDKGNGIGLNNVKRRLALHYPGRHILKYSERNSVYHVELELILG